MEQIKDSRDWSLARAIERVLFRPRKRRVSKLGRIAVCLCAALSIIVPVYALARSVGYYNESGAWTIKHNVPDSYQLKDGEKWVDETGTGGEVDVRTGTSTGTSQGGVDSDGNSYFEDSDGTRTSTSSGGLFKTMSKSLYEGGIAYINALSVRVIPTSFDALVSSDPVDEKTAAEAAASASAAASAAAGARADAYDRQSGRKADAASTRASAAAAAAAEAATHGTVFNKVSSFAQNGLIKPIASTILACALLVELAKISQRIDGSATLPGVRDVVFLAVFAAIFIYLIDHGFELCQALFSDLSVLWTSTSLAKADIGSLLDFEADIDGSFSTLLTMLFFYIGAFVTNISTHVVVWGNALQLYFFAALSPIPLAFLGFEQTRQMAISFLKNYIGLVLSFLAAAFLLYLFPSLLPGILASVAGSGFLIRAATGIAGVSLLGISIIKCGSWGRDLLGG